MKRVALLFIAVYAGQTLATECISPKARAALLVRIQKSVVQMDTPSDEEGSGFLLKSSNGTELVTAHHVLDKVVGAGKGCDGKAGKSQGLQIPTVNFKPGQPHKSLKPKFNSSKKNLSVPNDIIKTTLGGKNYAALEAQGGDRLPAMDEEIIIAGHPSAKTEEYTQHTCKFIGYGNSIASDAHATYSLQCNGVDYDIAGMSGGVAISACTGKVIGAVSAQDYDPECGKQGDQKHVSISPLSLSNGGAIEFGLPKTVGATVCWYSNKTTGRADIQRSCNVTPGKFPRYRETKEFLRAQRPANYPAITGR